jgi:hypothetical protein
VSLVTVKALSLWEPWASLMRTGGKTIETRSWPTAYRGPLLICASKRHRKTEVLHLCCNWAFQGGLAPLVGRRLDRTGKTWAANADRLIDALSFGKAVAVVDLYRVERTDSCTLGEVEQEREFGDYSPGRWAWFTRNLRAIEPFEMLGHQGLWNEVLDEERLRPVALAVA